MTFARIGRTLAFAVCVPALMLTGCGEVDPTAAPPSPFVESSLVGTWKGTVDGRSGTAVVTIHLRADSTISAEPGNSVECNLNGVWTVSDIRFTATGRDCSGTVVTLVSPVGSLRLTGTWTASIGTSGTFTVAKQ